MFPPGITTVELVATDTAGLDDTCYFEIEVIYDPGYRSKTAVKSIRGIWDNFRTLMNAC